MTKKLYWFNVPVRGEETFAVEAENEDDAINQIIEGNYAKEPELQDIYWDFEHRDPDYYLRRCISAVEDAE